MGTMSKPQSTYTMPQIAKNKDLGSKVFDEAVRDFEQQFRTLLDKKLGRSQPES